LSAPSTCAVFEGVLRSNPDQGEGDGDLHISLTPDGTRPNDNFDLLNSNNYKNGQPVMTAEVICWSTANKSYTDQWGQYCTGVNPKPHLPPLTQLKQNAHVRITGKWVQDVGYPTATHAKWNELHPVQSIQILKYDHYFFFNFFAHQGQNLNGSSEAIGLSDRASRIYKPSLLIEL